MKLKAIAKLIKDNKFIYTVEESGDSFWLGNGSDKETESFLCGRK